MTDWMVTVDLGTVEPKTFRYLFPYADHTTARHKGRALAKAEAAERGLPTLYCDVYVNAYDGTGPLHPNREVPAE